MKKYQKNTKFSNFKSKADNFIDKNRKLIITLIFALILLFITCFISSFLSSLLITFI